MLRDQLVEPRGVERTRLPCSQVKDRGATAAGMIDPDDCQSMTEVRAGVDASRLALFIVASLEGGMLLTRVKRDATVMAGIGEDLKEFVAMHMRGMGPP